MASGTELGDFKLRPFLRVGNSDRWRTVDVHFFAQPTVPFFTFPPLSWHGAQEPFFLSFSGNFVCF